MTGQRRTINAVFAANLKQAQVDAGMSNREVAQKLGISESHYGKWRRGEGKPDLENAVALAEVLGRPVEWFTEDHDEDKVAV